MPVLRTKTISVGDKKQRIQLKKKKNRMDRGGKHMYTIQDADRGGLIEDPFTRKRDAESAFQRTVEDIRMGMESAAEDTGGDLLGGSSGLDVPNPDLSEPLFDDDLL